MKSTYEAAWLPIGHEVPGEDPAAPAVEYVECQRTQTGQKGILVTHTRRDVATPSLARFAQEQIHVTRRSRAGASPGSGPVLVDMPDFVLLEFAHRLARGSSLCAVESGAFRLSGWAAATSAVDLATGQRAEPLNNDLLELLDRLLLAGNNGWADKPGKRDAQRLLGQLSAAAPSLDADFITGYVIGKGASDHGAKQLRAIFAK